MLIVGTPTMRQPCSVLAATKSSLLILVLVCPKLAFEGLEHVAANHRAAAHDYSEIWLLMSSSQSMKNKRMNAWANREKMMNALIMELVRGRTQ